MKTGIITILVIAALVAIAFLLKQRTELAPSMPANTGGASKPATTTGRTPGTARPVKLPEDVGRRTRVTDER